MEVQFGPNVIDEPNLQYKLHRKLKVFNTAHPLPNRGYNLVACSSKYGIVFVASPDGVLMAYYTKQIVDKECEQPLNLSVKLQESPTHIAISCDQEYLAVTGGQLLSIYKVVNFQNQNVSPSTVIKCDVNPATFVSSLQWNPCVPDTIAIAFFDGTLFVSQVDSMQVKKVLAKARCICWSPKGKQLVVGNNDGTLCQYKPDLSPMKVVPAPNIFNGAPVEVIAVHWISTYQFAVVYRNASDNSRPAVTIVNTPKGGQPVCLNYEDICYSMGSSRPWFYYLLGLAQWNILMTSSSNSMEIATLGSADGATWLQWSQTDEARPELPLTDKKQENYPVGLSIDTCAIHQLPWGENQTLPFMPLLHVVSQTGLLTTYNIINTTKENVCVPPQPLTLPVAAMTSAIPGAAPAPPAAPAPTPAANQPSPPSYPQATPLQAAPPATSAFSATATSAFSTSTQAAGALGTSAQSPSAFSAPTSAFSPPTNQGATVQSAAKTFSGFGQQPPPAYGQGFSSTPPALEQKVPAVHKVVPTQAITPSPQSQPATPTDAAPPISPSPLPSPAQSAPSPEANAAAKAEQARVNALRVSQELKNMLIKEVNDFQTGLYRFMVKTRDMQNLSAREINSLDSSFNLQSLDTDQFKADCSLDELRGAIVTLKLELVRACAVVAEARTIVEAKDQQWSQPDPLSAKHHMSVRKLAYYVQNQLEQAHKELDHKWNQLQTRDPYSKPGQRMIRPILDDVYQPLVQQQEILARQEAVLKMLRKTFNECEGTPVFRSTSILRSTPFRNKDPLSKLTKNVLNMSLEPQNKTSKASGLTPQKLDALRDMLSNHKTVKIKPVSVELSQHLEAMRLSYQKSVKEKAAKIAQTPPTSQYLAATQAAKTSPLTQPSQTTQAVKSSALAQLPQTTQPVKSSPAVQLTPTAQTNLLTSAAKAAAFAQAQAILYQSNQTFEAVKPENPKPSPISVPTFSPQAKPLTAGLANVVRNLFDDEQKRELKASQQQAVSQPPTSGAKMPPTAAFTFSSSATPPVSAPAATASQKTRSVLKDLLQNKSQANDANTFMDQKICSPTAFTASTPTSAQPTTAFASKPIADSNAMNRYQTKTISFGPVEPALSTPTKSPVTETPKAASIFDGKPKDDKLATGLFTVKPATQNVPDVLKTFKFAEDKTSEAKPAEKVAEKAKENVPEKAESVAVAIPKAETDKKENEAPKPAASVEGVIPSAAETIKKEVKEQNVTIPASSASSIFAAANAASGTEQTSPTVFSSSTSIFSNAPPADKSTNLFGSLMKTPNSAASVFGSANASISEQATVQSSTGSVFGNSSTSASSVFSSASTPSSVFGTATTAEKSVFGTAAFSSSKPTVFSTPTPASPGSVFGTTPTSQTSVFGSSSAFGSPATTQSAFGSTTSPQTSAFGTTAPSPSSVFGTSTAATAQSVFASPSTAQTSIFGSAPATTQASIFGAATNTTQSSVFGTPTPSTPASVFGTQATQSSVFGTPPRPAQTSVFGTPPASQASVFGTQATAQGSMFGGNTATTQSSVFGTPATTAQSGGSLFGTPDSMFAAASISTTTASPQSGGNIFGGSPSSSVFGGGNTNVFGSKPTFGQASPSAASIFGGASSFGQAPPSNPWGSGTNTSSAFGSSAFGQQTTTSQSSSIFGGGGGGSFSSSTPGQAFGAPPNQGSVFGTPQQQTAPAFGGSPAFGSKPAFGQPAGFGASSGFGQPAFGGGGFNKSPSSGFGAPAAFGGTAFGSTSPGKAFGSAAPASGFGSPTQSNSTFENLATQNTLTFGNLAQQSGPAPAAQPSFNTSPSFTGWRG